jgi:hypothetical protein
MYPHVTQFETLDNRRREVLAAMREEPPEVREKRRRLLIRVPWVTSQPCR